MTRDDILDKVRKTLVDSLNVDDDQVTTAARLKGDLGAESIDFLDIVFRLDQQFKQYGFTINREELFPESIFQGDAKFVANGKVTEFGLAELEKQMPYADLSEFKKDPKIDKVEDLFTVELIVRYLEWKIASKK
jgi:acyl carrier protein